MSNMSYCRFHNTSMDLDDCRDALEALAGVWDEDGEAPEPLSEDETRAAKRLIRLCHIIADQFDEEDVDLLNQEVSEA